MTVLLRVVLLLASFASFLYVVRKIRKSQFQIADSVFWVFFFLMFLVLGIAPQIGEFFASLLGFQSAVNFILVAVIFVMLVKIFAQSFQISQLDNKIRTLTQRITLEKHIEKTKLEQTANGD